MKRIFIALFILLLGAVFVAMIAANLQTHKSEKKQTVTQKENVTGETVTFTVTEGAHKKWTINAKKAVYYTDNSGATLKDIEGTFFSDEGKPVMAFLAPDGKYVTKDHQVTLTGGVQAHTLKDAPQSLPDQGGETNADAVSLKAPKMSWSSRSNIVTAEGGVDMSHGASGKSQADRCRFTLDLSSISLDGHVKTAMSL